MLVSVAQHKLEGEKKTILTAVQQGELLCICIYIYMRDTLL